MSFKSIYCCNEDLSSDEFDSYYTTGLCPICKEDWLDKQIGINDVCDDCGGFKAGCQGLGDCLND